MRMSAADGLKGASRKVPTAQGDATRVAPRRESAPAQPTIGPRTSGAARIAGSAARMVGAVDAVASAAESGAALRRGNVRGAALAAAGAAAATVGVSKTARKALGSLARDSRGATESARRMADRARRPGNELLNDAEAQSRISVTRQGRMETRDARDRADLSLDYNRNYNERLQGGNIMDTPRPSPGIVHRTYDFFSPGAPEQYVSIPQYGGAAMNMGAQSNRVRRLEATARENETIARASRRKK
jgi:hypothetical protein